MYAFLFRYKLIAFEATERVSATQGNCQKILQKAGQEDAQVGHERVNT